MINNFTGEYLFLSNFYEAPVEYEGITYRNNIAAFQAQKTCTYEERRKFADMNVGKAKFVGANVKLRPDWEEVKTDIMYDICRCKFEQNPELAEKLIATGDEYLAEDNTWGDNIWGTVDGKGENRLGIILMAIRRRLQNERV